MQTGLGYTTKYEEFAKWLKEDASLVPAGEPVKEFQRQGLSHSGAAITDTYIVSNI